MKTELLQAVPVRYISTWNGGFEVETAATWAPSTGKVIDIKGSTANVDADGDELEFLESEKIILPEGIELEVNATDIGYAAELTRCQVFAAALQIEESDSSTGSHEFGDSEFDENNQVFFKTGEDIPYYVVNQSEATELLKEELKSVCSDSELLTLYQTIDIDEAVNEADIDAYFEEKASMYGYTVYTR